MHIMSSDVPKILRNYPPTSYLAAPLMMKSEIMVGLIWKRVGGCPDFGIWTLRLTVTARDLGSRF